MEQNFSELRREKLDSVEISFENMAGCESRNPKGVIEVLKPEEKLNLRLKFGFVERERRELQSLGERCLNLLD